MSKFRVGDEVRAISASYGWGYVTKGDIGHVLSIGGLDELQVDFPNKNGWHCSAEDLELVEPKITVTLGGSKPIGVFGGVTYGGVPIAIYPNPPHKHKDLIIAWANGADIEIQDKIGKWHDIEDPTWYENGIYRAKSTKPTKTPLELKIEKCEAKLAKLKGQL